MGSFELVSVDKKKESEKMRVRHIAALLLILSSVPLG